jgi:integrase
MQIERFGSMPEFNELDKLTDAEKRALIAKWQSEVGGSNGARARQRRKSRPLLYLTDDEINNLFRAIESEGKRSNSRTDPMRDRALFEVALGRGLRASEVGLIELDHLRLKENRLYVTRLKGGRTGEYLITDREVRALKPYLKKRGWLPGPYSPAETDVQYLGAGWTS